MLIGNKFACVAPEFTNIIHLCNAGYEINALINIKAYAKCTITVCTVNDDFSDF